MAILLKTKMSSMVTIQSANPSRRAGWAVEESVTAES